MNNQNFFLLTGKRVELARAELSALVKSYHPDAKLTSLSERVSVIYGQYDLKKITSRSACVKYAGHLLSLSKVTGFDLNGHFRNYRRFACKLVNLSKKYVDMEPLQQLGKYIKEKSPWMQVSLDNPDVTVLYIVTDNGAIVGLSEYNGAKLGNVRNRPYFHPVVLEPHLSRIMVNLTMVKENDLLLDPFCGTGSIILEAATMKIRTIGCDLSSKMCYGSIANTGNVDTLIINCDALSLPLQTRGIDAIATDLPYGRAASAMKRPAKELLKEFVSLISDEMKGKRCCVMCRKGDEQLFDNIVEAYDIYVHRSLTRKLMVLCN